MDNVRTLAGTIVAATAGALLLFAVTAAGFMLVINNQAWPAGGDAVAGSLALFMLALTPAWVLAVYATLRVVTLVTPRLRGSTRAALTIDLTFAALVASFQLALLLTWDN